MHLLLDLSFSNLKDMVWLGGPPSYLVSCFQPLVRINTAFGPAPLNSRITHLAFACSLSAVAGGAVEDPDAQQYQCAWTLAEELSNLCFAPAAGERGKSLIRALLRDFLSSEYLPASGAPREHHSIERVGQCGFT